jgi:GNAT superfamily N-acetyltransferase
VVKVYSPGVPHGTQMDFKQRNRYRLSKSASIDTHRHEAEVTHMNPPASIRYRDAEPTDVSALRTLIFEHGPNPWNHLPEDGVNAHLDRIHAGDEWAVTAWAGATLVGFISYRVGRIFPQYEPEVTRDTDHAYVVEGVVDRQYAGSGIGTALMELVKERLRVRGIAVVYADRHEENVGSARLMAVTGFEIVDTFAEPHRRPHGSGRTSVGRCRLD